jgi:hypothetical protein
LDLKILATNSCHIPWSSDLFPWHSCVKCEVGPNKVILLHTIGSWVNQALNHKVWERIITRLYWYHVNLNNLSDN